MDAGKLRHRITITPKGTNTINANGFNTTPGGTPTTVFAARENLYGSEFFNAARNTGKAAVKFTIRYRQGIDRNITVTADNQVYNVLYADDIRGEHKWIELMCEAVE